MTGRFGRYSARVQVEACCKVNFEYVIVSCSGMIQCPNYERNPIMTSVANLNQKETLHRHKHMHSRNENN
jgi:hypothetical protein